MTCFFGQKWNSISSFGYLDMSADVSADWMTA